MPSTPETSTPERSVSSEEGTSVRPLALVVEDDASIGHIMVFILEREGFDVEWTTTGTQARSFIHSQAPAAIAILDITLPDLNGYQILKEIRSHTTWATTPVLMLTAMSQSKDVELAIAEGANDYLLKPFHPQEVISRVHRLCR
jgi:two-component system, OmpR family, alkaline phosphatase synthesis response regulator PhoP